MTLASTAMHLFRRKYLRRNIATQNSLNAIADHSYIASRVETHRIWVDQPGLYYDFNSMFPYAMTKTLPGALRGNFTKLPSMCDVEGGEFPVIADCTIEVREMDIPPLPLRIGPRIFFPVGQWRNWFTGPDLSLLQEMGGKILKVHHAKVFYPQHDLNGYANDLYNMRAKTKDPFERGFFKLLLNALYGKFAEQSEKTSLLINPTIEQLNKLDDETDMFAPNMYFKQRNVPIAHAHVPISAYITAISRALLCRTMNELSKVYYCDTDGFATDLIDELELSNVLGGLKLEKTFETATFPVPKFYSWQTNDGVRVVKAKGFPLKFSKIPDGKGKWRYAEAGELFDHLIGYGEVKIERMRRIRENRENRSPTDVTVYKGLRQIQFMQGIYKDVNSIPKRFVYPDGHTRPWTVEELTE
jgi:hypothetical protein